MPFVHLQVKSGYSLLSSSAKVERIVERASELGYKALAITDENVMYGVVPFYKECKKHGIKPIIGLTVSVILENDDLKEAHPMILLAKDNQGYRNLLKISSAIQTKSKDGIPKRWLTSYRDGLIGICTGQSGVLGQELLKDNDSQARNLILQFKNIFQEGCFYLGIQDHLVKEDRILNESLIEISKATNIPLVATNDVQYIDRSDSFAHECLLSIKNGTKLSDDEREKLPSDEFYLKSSTEMIELFSDLPEVIENTNIIADQCNVEIQLGSFALPKYPVPNGESADEYLSRICLKGLHERYKEITDEHFERLNFELEVIKKMNFSDYFLIVWDFMKYAHEQGILTGPGRGSAAGSIVAYVLHITEVDPIKYSLLFERFLNPERISMPDIDIDFPDNRRDEMIEYVAKKYGQLHVAQIITYGTLAARAALRDIGRVMGISTKEADYIAKQVPGRIGISLKQAYEESKPLRDYINNVELGRKIYETALKIEGLPRHTSIHAAGVVISEQPLTDLIAIQEGHNNVFITQFSMDILEEIGLLKMDFLGLRNLTLLDNILKLVKRSTGKTLELSEISLQDQKTFSILGKGDTTGIFQLESSGMRSVLARLKPSALEDIVAVNALYRPGPMENIPVYIARKHKKEMVQYPHQDLEHILEKTNGVIIYQEQIIQIASTMAGFSLGEADLLRRAVSKKKKEVLDKERTHFVNGSIKKGYDKKVANEIYDLIVRFANYGFNRSHAVAYSLIAYQLAYLKANYPLFFYSALLTSVVGNDEKIAQYIREAKQKGISILPPSINKSLFPFLVEKGAIRFSLAAIKGVGAATLRDIIEIRKKKAFTDLFDFCIRIPVRNMNRRTVEMLIYSGAFDEFGEDRATLFESLSVAIDHAELVSPKDQNQHDLFFDDGFDLKPKYVKAVPLKSVDKLMFEKEALGFYLSSHPISPFTTYLNNIGATSICNLPEVTQRKVDVGVFVTNERTIRTKKGEIMAFLTVSDETGDIDAVAFPNVYTQYGKLLQNDNLVLIKGKVESRNNQLQFIINHVEELTDQNIIANKVLTTLYLKIESEQQADLIFGEIKELLKSCSGSTEVVVHFENPKKTIKLQEEFFVNPTEEFIEQLKDLLGGQNVVLK
ncbi:DNA polymerase III subunit alpha [Fredinandcohnia quinoae]|uniref:DNA polymerase III subunit alpha n=1 Tax=Fredinandcohnia quinoae TaxID=2918902 RepID=A0AAW5E8K7_9BACI|nr:DNA polymerase III subunit alpha [Fredinandcohnia sp. SECRCQ15]MCH1627824.1 DNA polymerase III subunit alpha [Fredinandcohnia sp. SECRCQ15]